MLVSDEIIALAEGAFGVVGVLNSGTVIVSIARESGWHPIPPDQIGEGVSVFGVGTHGPWVVVLGATESGPAPFASTAFASTDGVTWSEIPVDSGGAPGLALMFTVASLGERLVVVGATDPDGDGSGPIFPAVWIAEP